MSIVRSLLFMAVIATVQQTAFTAAMRSLNGRKVVLMSMDGFRYDYLNKTETPNMDAMIKSGVTVPYVNNTFTTQTFPSHYSIATGRYEESHGMVGNTMYDPVFNASFSRGNIETRWWDGAEPIWINAVKAGLKVGAYFWPGSEVQLEGLYPTKYTKYNYSVPFESRVDTVVTSWLSEDNFDFGVIYFGEPDYSGHKYGPESPQMVKVIQRMDRLLGYFMDKLKEANLTDSVDLVLTSDHGMTTVDVENRMINLSNYVDSSLLLEVVEGGPIVHLRPQPGKAEELVKALSSIEHMSVYLKKDIPDRYHYKHHRRIMPVVVVPDEGWEVTKNGKGSWAKKGDHGYDNSLMSMKPFFIASGPSFKQGAQLDPIDSVDIYPLLCHLLNLDAAPHNGSFDRVQGLLHGNMASFNSVSFYSIILCVNLVLILSRF